MLGQIRSTNVVFHDIARFRAQVFDRLIAPHGLTMSQAWVLAHLFVEDELTQSEIAKRMEISTVTLGGFVDRLEARGLVERRVDPEDRRAKRVCLKEAAWPLGRIMKRCGDQVNDASFAGMPAEVVEQTMANLITVRENLLATLQKDKSDRGDSGLAPAGRKRKRGNIGTA